MRKARSEEAAAAPVALNRGDWAAAVGVGLFALLVYVLTLAPTVTGEDSGELIGAAYTLGVPHPPGYPVWTMLAHAFTWIPIDTVAWRVNFLSACCGAATLTILTLVGITLTGNRLAAMLGALIFGFSRVFWEHALIAEVYTLNTCLIAGMLLLCVRGLPRPGALSSLALLAGIGTGVHSTSVILVPFWALYAWTTMTPAQRRAPLLYLKATLLFVLGTSVYLYLPIASHFDPAVDWGDPETLQRWWDVVRREQFAFMVDQYPRSVARFAGQMGVMGLFWFRDLLGLGALLGLWGGWLLLRRNAVLAKWLGCMALATIVAAVWMQNFEQNREWWWVMRVFLLPAELLTAVGITGAIAWGGSGRPRVRFFVSGVATAVVLASLVFNAQVSKRGYFYAEDYARNLLATMPEGAIYVPGGDHQAFPVMYLQAVEDLRPDVTLLRKYGYLDLASIPGLAEAAPERWGRFPPRRFEPEILRWILEHDERPLVLTQEMSIAGPNPDFVPIGLLVQAVRAGAEPAPAVSLEALAWRKPLPEAPVEEYTLSLIQYDVALARARMAFEKGDRDAALAHMASAAAYGHRAPEILNNLGVLCGRNAAWDAAAEYFRAVLEEHPEHEAARKNLERVERRRAM